MLEAEISQSEAVSIINYVRPTWGVIVHRSVQSLTLEFWDLILGSFNSIIKRSTGQLIKYRMFLDI